MKTMNIFIMLPALAVAFFLPTMEPTINFHTKPHIDKPNLLSKVHNHDVIQPKELCPIIQEIENKLCIGQENGKLTPKDLCPLLKLYNDTFCQTKLNNETLNELTIEVRMKEDFEKENEEMHFDPKELCPLLGFVDEEFCPGVQYIKKEEKVKFDPKELCPLLNFTYTELCH